MRVQRMRAHEVAEIFRQADTDESKSVTLQEWMATFFHSRPQVCAQYSTLKKQLPFHSDPAYIYNK